MLNLSLLNLKTTSSPCRIFPKAEESFPNYTDKLLNGIEKSFRVCIVLCMKFEKKMSSFIQLLIAEEIWMKC